jgi:hypothetical protein
VQPKATISVFSADPSEVDGQFGLTTLTWEAKGAVKCTLKINGVEQDLPGISGSKDVPVAETQTFELIAYDDRGLKVRKSVKVTVKKATPPDDSPPKIDEGGSGTTGTSGGATKTGGRR